MKTIICGGRNYFFTEKDFAILDRLRATLSIEEVVSGGANGADMGGEMWAARHSIPVSRHPADWKGKGRVAGFLRNQDMADYAQACICFPGGTGTADMKRRAEKRGLIVVEAHPIYVVKGGRL